MPSIVSTTTARGGFTTAGGPSTTAGGRPCCLSTFFILPYDKNRLEPSVGAYPLAFPKGGGVSLKCVFVIDTYGPLKGWQEVTHNVEVMRRLAGRRQGHLQVCVLLLPLSSIYKMVGKYFRNVGVFSSLEFPVKCVPEGLSHFSTPSSLL